jgi:hypothetical protein
VSAEVAGLIASIPEVSGDAVINLDALAARLTNVTQYAPLT